MNLKGEGWYGALVWGVYFGASVFGHVALKRAAGAGGAYDFSRSVTALITPWGVAALAAWALSAWAWTLALTRHTLVDANAVSALRIVFCALAAVVWLGERVGLREAAGTALVAAGVCLLRG